MTRREKSLFYFLAFILLLVFLVSLSGCSDKATKYLRKAEKHERKRNEYIQKAITHGAKVKSDTTWATLPVITPEIEWTFDTKLYPSWQTHRLDSIPFRDKKTGVEVTASIELKEGCPDDCIERLRLEGKIPRDTIYVPYPVEVKNEISCPPKDNKWMWIALALGALIVVIFLVKR